MLSSFLCLSSALANLAIAGGNQDELTCLDSETGENAQSLLSSLVNVKLKHMQTGVQSSTNLERLSGIQSGHASGESLRHSNSSFVRHGSASLMVQKLASHFMTQHISAPDHTSSKTDYIVDGDNPLVNHAVAAASGPLDFHSDKPSAKTDSTVGVVVAAAAAEAKEATEVHVTEPPGWQPPAPRSGGEVKEPGAPPAAFAKTKVHNLPPPKPAAEVAVDSETEADNVEIVALLKKMHPSFWMDVLLFFLVFGCCCCCLREIFASFREKQIEDHQKEKQIVSYDQDRLVHLSILLRLFTRGSLCAKAKVWSQVGFFLILWVVLTVVLLSTIRYASKLDDKSIRTLSSYLTSFMPFFFAMYLNVVFGRWWTMRTAGLGAMWQAVDDMCVILASHCPGDKFESQRSTLLRYGLLSQALIYQVARKEVDLQELLENGILMPSEMKALEEAPGSMPQTVWVWILDLWRKLHSEGHIEWWVVQHAQKLIGEGRRAIKTIFTYVTCQIPFGWVHLMTFMVNITLIVLVLKAAIITAKDIADMQASPNPCTMDIRDGFSCNSDFHDQVSIFSQVIQLIIVPFLFLAFLEFTNELTNPFGEDPHDFPRHVYMCGMRDENLGFFHVAGKGTLVGAPPILSNLK